MNDKEKQIEELAQDIADNCLDMVENCCGSKPCYVCLAERLAKDHYQKIDKDKVVLTREEWKQIKNSLYYSKEALEKKLEKTRKETAEKILKHLYDACKEDTYGQVVVDFTILENFAKQFGVEIGE